MTDLDLLARVRTHLPAARAAAYFNAGTFGPLPDVALEAMATHAREDHENGRIGGRGLARTFAPIRLAREAFALATHADVDDLALTSSTTDGLNLVLGGLDWNAGDEVLTSDAEHYGLTVPLGELARRRGVIVKTLPLSNAPDPISVVADALSTRTRLVALSHVLWTTGRVLPVHEVASLVRSHGALSLVDGAQSVGAIDVDVPALGADFYTISGQKWLCGAMGTGALYVRRERRDTLAPAFSGYPTMDLHDPGAPTLWPTAKRFDMPALSLTALAGTAAAIRWRHALGWEATSTHARRLAETLRARVRESQHLRLADTHAASSTIVAIELAGRSPEAIAATLESKAILVRAIPGTPWLRVAVGFWNDERDLDALSDALAAL